MPFFNEPTSREHAPKITVSHSRRRETVFVIPARFAISRPSHYPGEFLFGLKSAPIALDYYKGVPFGVIDQKVKTPALPAGPAPAGPAPAGPPPPAPAGPAPAPAGPAILTATEIEEAKMKTDIDALTAKNNKTDEEVRQKSKADEAAKSNALTLNEAAKSDEFSGEAIDQKLENILTGMSKEEKEQILEKIEENVASPGVESGLTLGEKAVAEGKAEKRAATRSPSPERMKTAGLVIGDPTGSLKRGATPPQSPPKTDEFGHGEVYPDEDYVCDENTRKESLTKLVNVITHIRKIIRKGSSVATIKMINEYKAAYITKSPQEKKIIDESMMRDDWIELLGKEKVIRQQVIERRISKDVAKLALKEYLEQQLPPAPTDAVVARAALRNKVGAIRGASSTSK